jgi:DNA-binding MarR family transcriptional regulator
VSEIAEKLQMQTSNVSTAVRSLVQRGLVERHPDERDRRVVLLHPTARARAERRAIEDAIAAKVIAALETVPADDLRALQDAAPVLRVLTRLIGGDR